MIKGRSAFSKFKLTKLTYMHILRSGYIELYNSIPSGSKVECKCYGMDMEQTFYYKGVQGPP